LTLDSFQNINEGDFIAISNAGAYGSSMSSNYNIRPNIAEILVNKNKFSTIRRRQNLEDLISQ
jgi:diaminopimelate decarboxylase